jgi:hypothetical protein
MIKLLSFFLLLLPLSIAAQNASFPVSVAYQNGLRFATEDTSFSTTIRFRVQSRAGYISEALDKTTPSQFDLRVRRLRLRLDGNLINQKLTYNIQLSFSRADMDWDVSGVPNVLRDAMIWYQPWKGMKIGMGQSKLPGNRQFIMSSGDLELIDRSIVSTAYTLDRDVGVFAYQNINVKKVVVRLKAALTSGEGRNPNLTNKGLATTGRIEILPFGEFSNNNDFSEADIAFEPKPKLSIAGVAHYNDRAIRTQGQLGKMMATSHYISSWMADMVFKYNGFALSAEYLIRNDDNPFDKRGSSLYVLTGQGLNVQASVVFENMWCIAGRYALTAPGEKIKFLEPERKQYGICFSKFLKGHRIKIQTEIQFNEEYKYSSNKSLSIKQFMAGYLQVELGI